MKVSKEGKEEFFRRRDVLDLAKIELKKDFVGLNDIIDEIIDLIEPWYLFPSGQIRPTVINLFGMTGVGKTSLIKKLFELINLQDNLYKFDVGDYATQDNTKLSYSFSEKLRNREKHQIGFIFDEFQLGRTIDEQGLELEKSGLRAMWDLLDSGKISILQSSYSGTKTYQLTLKLEDCINNGGVEVKNGKVSKNISYHEKYFKNDDDDTGFQLTSKKKRKNKKNEDNSLDSSLFIPKEFYWYIQEIWENRFLTERELGEYLKTLNQDSTIEFLNDTINKAFKPMEYDFSTSCIFVIGNIDEAYRMAKNIDPDSDADRFYKHSLKITLPQIKSALQSRFRAEQIARLGNNHIIYPAFSSKVYKELISLELNKSINKIKERFDIDVKFSNSINDIIYKEGVFPTQGARPVFTTIAYLIESYVGKIIRDILLIKEPISYIEWEFSGKSHTVYLFNQDSMLKELSYPVKLKIESLRESENSELQAQVAIHEAGHAVAAIYAANILPSEIVSRSANISEGHCVVEIPSTGLQTKEELEKDIIISLGGYVAEELIFGEKNISNGTGGDFERATNIALNMAKTYGMLDRIPMLYGHKNISTNSHWNSAGVDYMDILAERKINDSKFKCLKILKENKLLLLKLAEYLSVNSRIESSEINDFVIKYGNPVEIKNSDNYHNFKSIISDKIYEEENGFKPKKSILQRYMKKK